MADIFATFAGGGAPAAVPQPLQLAIIFGGFFDQAIFGVPLWFWMAITFGVAFGIFFVYAMWVYWTIGPVWGYWEAYKTKQPMALKRNKNRKMRMMALKYAARIFNDEETDEMWSVTSLDAAQQLGSVNCVDVVDWHDWVDDVVKNEAIRVAAGAWNDEVKKENANKSSDAKDLLEYIYDYTTFQKHLSNGDLKRLLPDGVKLDAFFIVDWTKIEQYMPKERAAASYGGLVRSAVNDRLGSTEKKAWGAVLPVGLMCTMILITAIVAYMILNL
ncbi:MAG: hypothetical protein MUO73_00990 [Thermoplasmata archaeon]|nr:hypothetical protein [Thermoplasmata archaeon]